MSQLFFSFNIDLSRHERPFLQQPPGPLFHRWLPDGQNNAILLPTGTSKIELSVWFSRDSKGSASQGSTALDNVLLPRQAILDAGPLAGLVVFRSVSAAQLGALNEDMNGLAYVRFAKQLIKIVIPPVSSFVDTLRTKYGQYWLAPVPTFDSRRESLGNYCNTLGLSWSTDLKTWRMLIPGGLVIKLSATKTPHDAYLALLTESDWQDLKLAPPTHHSPPLDTTILLRACELIGTDNLRYAFIEAVTAAEIRVDRMIEDTFRALNIPDDPKRLLELPLKLKLAFVASHDSSLSPHDLTQSIIAIDIRNKIVHDGAEPAPHSEASLKALIRVVARLSGGITKLPSPYLPHFEMDPLHWDQVQEDRMPPFPA